MGYRVLTPLEAFLEDLECDVCGGKCVKVAENVYECTQCGDCITINENGQCTYEIGSGLDERYDDDW